MQQKLPRTEARIGPSRVPLAGVHLDNAQMEMKEDLAEETPSRVYLLEKRVEELEKRVISLTQAFSLARHGSRRIRPPLWTFEQYAPRALDIPPGYRETARGVSAPRVAIVTPSLNYARYLRPAIDSVLSQGYSNLAYHVQDGGSSDGTREILAACDGVSWTSAPDTGQAQAINRGFSTLGDSEIMGYLNSDDVLLPGTLAYVTREFDEHPSIDLIYGNRIFIDSDGRDIGRVVLPRHDKKTLLWADYVPQETLFWRRRVWDRIGPFDENFQYALDWEFILRAGAAGFNFRRVPRFLACFRVHDRQKTAVMYDIGRQEMQQLRKRYLGFEPSTTRMQFAVAPYLVRQLAYHWLYKAGILERVIRWRSSAKRIGVTSESIEAYESIAHPVPGRVSRMIRSEQA